VFEMAKNGIASATFKCQISASQIRETSFLKNLSHNKHDFDIGTDIASTHTQNRYVVELECIMGSIYRNLLWGSGCVLLSATLTLSTAFAQDEDMEDVPQGPPASETPTEVLTSVGQAVYLKWADGRVATIKVAQRDSKLLSVPYKIADNSCTNRQAMSCDLKLKYRQFWFALVWVQHPDPNRVGQVVKRTTEANGEAAIAIESQESTIGIMQKTYPLVSQGLAKPELQCADFSWLPGGSSVAPESLRLTRWDSENNEPNPETGIGENRTNGGAYGVTFRRASPKSLQIESIEGFSGVAKTDEIFFAAPITTMIIRKPGGDLCQTGVATGDLQTIAKEVGEVTQKAPDWSQVEPYIPQEKGDALSLLFDRSFSSYGDRFSFFINADGYYFL